MKNKLIIALIALAPIATIQAADTGSIDLSLQIGNSNALQVLEVTTDISSSVTLETTEVDGIRKLSQNSLGTMSFSGTDVGTGLTCVAMFTGLHSSGSNYQLENLDNNTHINYSLKIKNEINGQVTNPNFQHIRASHTNVNTPLRALSTAVSQGVNACSIKITELIIFSHDDLTNKNGIFTDTLTYTMTAI